MKISIIGAGNVGRAVAQSARRAGHQVTITSAGGNTASSVATETGATVASSNIDAVTQLPKEAAYDLILGLGAAAFAINVGISLLGLSSGRAQQRLERSENDETLAAQERSGALAAEFSPVSAAR
jgi:saccharopine dehydrogenase-like NADP-dependent oxidoreductase